MSRSGYNEDCEYLDLWRGAVRNAIRGKRGQAFLREMLEALDALPEKQLIAGELVDANGEVCGMGAVCKRRSLDVSSLDPDDRDAVSQLLGIAPALAAEIAFINDEVLYDQEETPQERFQRVRRWVERQLKNPGSE